MGVQMRVKNIINNLICEKWKPKNKKKHAACKAKVKSKVDVWPSAYASGQVVQCYYGKNLEENTNMENLIKLFEKKKSEKKKKSDCGCGDPVITEAKKKDNLAMARKIINKTRREGKRNVSKAAKEAAKSDKPKKKGSKKKSGRGSPWFIDRETRNDKPWTKRKKIPRKHPNRSYMTPAQVKLRTKIYNKLVATAKKKGQSLTASVPGPAKNRKEQLAATATKLALDRG